MKQLLIAVIFFFSTSVYAQRPDKKGSSDHPLISRYEGFNIKDYQSIDFDKYRLPLSAGKDEKFDKYLDLEGKVVKILYGNNTEGRPSLFQLVKNYEAAFKSKDAELMFACYADECGVKANDLVTITAINEVALSEFLRFGKHAYRAYNFSKEGVNYYAALYFREEKNQIQYELHVIETKPLALDKVTVADIDKGIKEKGKVAFYGIYFDTGKSTIKEESEPALSELAGYLKKNPDQGFYIVGHTDNAGDYELNMNLSERRATSVLDWIKSKGLNISKLKAVGVGPVSPMASNESESGKSRNRRVELVLK
ncbi:MAG: OmpA family protein [Bacteroidota bacterium]